MSAPRLSVKVASVVLLLTSLATALAQVETQPVGNFIEVVGQGVAYGEPDQATLTLGVTSESQDVREAVARLDETMASVLQALEQVGIPTQNIRTTAYDLWREELYPPGRPVDEQGTEVETTIVFHARHMVSVRVDGADRSGEVLAAAIEAGANAVGGISFGFSDAGQLEAEARQAAMADAHERARQLAEAAGVSLGEVVSIQELGGSQPPRPLFERSAAVMSDSPIATGQLSVEAQVAVRFLLTQP